MPALKHTIICEVQVVFDSTSNLIRNTFSFDKVGQQVSKRFRETGSFTLEQVCSAAAKHTDNLLPVKKLIELLKHLNILTTLSPSPAAPASAAKGKASPDTTYFMPCVLKRATAEEMSVPAHQTQRDPAPLMVRYKCGYTPAGLFPSMITSLVSQNMEHWQMIPDGLRKNRVQFYVGEDYDTVTFSMHPCFIQVALARDEEAESNVSTERVCAELCHVVKTTLKNVTARMNSHFTMGYHFGFECPVHVGCREHLCVVENMRASRMLCLQNPKRKRIVKMQSSHKVWFSDLKGVFPSFRSAV